MAISASDFADLTVQIRPAPTMYTWESRLQPQVSQTPTDKYFTILTELDPAGAPQRSRPIGNPDKVYATLVLAGSEGKVPKDLKV